MSKARDPLDITKEALEKALTSNKSLPTYAKGTITNNKETPPKDKMDLHKKTPH